MMPFTHKRAFYIARHEQELVAAEAATAHCARVAHLELALRYAMLAEQRTASMDAGVSPLLLKK
jgi:hypothetical protein